MYHGALKASAVVNQIKVMLTQSEVRSVLGDCGTSVLLASGYKLRALSGLVDEVPSLQLVIDFDSGAHATEAYPQGPRQTKALLAWYLPNSALPSWVRDGSAAGLFAWPDARKAGHRRADELQIAISRPDGSQRGFPRSGWVRVGDALYVRSYRREGVNAVQQHTARIRAAGVDATS